MKFSEMYPKDRFYAADMQGRPWTLTFADPAVTHKLTEEGEVDPKMPPIWHFTETKKCFPAVKTNGVCARALFGDESDAWAGHKITLYPAEDTSGLSDDGLCIRVKGSPEIDRKVVFKATIGRTKKTFTLTPTKNAAPTVDSDTGEVFANGATETALSGDEGHEDAVGAAKAALDATEVEDTDEQFLEATETLAV